MRKKIKLILCLSILGGGAFAQNNNTFPSTGSAGVGTTTPSEKLEVVGNTKVKGNLTVTDTSKFKNDVKFTFLNDNSQTQDRVLGINPNGKLKTYSNILFNTTQGVLDVNGNIFSSGTISANSLNVSGVTTFTNKIQTGRIIPLTGDTVIHFGDSSLVFLPNSNNISGSTNGVFKGISLGAGSRGKGFNSAAMGSNSQAYGSSAIAIGVNVQTDVTSQNNIVIGNSIGSLPLVNKISSSLMIGFNSAAPTLFISPANGGITTGTVCIGTTQFPDAGNPNRIYKLAVNGTIIADEIEVLKFNQCGFSAQTDPS